MKERHKIEVFKGALSRHLLSFYKAKTFFALIEFKK